MAMRFLGGAALVLLGAAAVDASVSSLARSKARRDGAIDGAALSPAMRSAFLDAARALQSAVLLREPPLSGERLRAAERGLVRVLEGGGGDSKRDADIRLLLALLAARDGRFDEALLRYQEVANDDPSDLRPAALGCVLCCLVGKPDEGMSVWLPRLRGLLLGTGAAAADDEVLDPLRPLVGELVIAAALGGAPYAIGEDDAHALTTQLVMFCAADRTDAWLAAALQDEEVPATKKMRLWAVRAFLHAKSAVLKAKLLSAMVSAAGLAVAESKEGEEGDEAA